MKLFLVRHGETEENAKRITTGQKPGHLTAKGKAHARALAGELSRCHIDAIISSDLKRCKDTVAIIRKRVKVPVLFAKELREISSGVLDGKPQLALRMDMAASEDSRLHYKPKGGESLLEFRKRVRSFLKNLRASKEFHDATVLLCTHTAWIKEYLIALRKPKLIHRSVISLVLQ